MHKASLLCCWWLLLIIYLILLLLLLIKKLLSWRNQVGLVLSLFFIFHNDNPYKHISLNSPDFIKVIIDLYPAVSVVTLAGGAFSCNHRAFWEWPYSLLMYFSTQNNHGPGGVQLNPWNPKQEVSDPETCLTSVPSLGLCPPGDTPALHRAGCSPSTEVTFTLWARSKQRCHLSARCCGNRQLFMSQLWPGCGYFPEHILPVVMGTVGTN